MPVSNSSGYIRKFRLYGVLANALNIEAYQLFYDETVANVENPSQTEYIASLKTNFLEKMASELDTIIDKIKK
jgi:hypothetical protein